MKEIIVRVVPSCVSTNREAQYMLEVERAYLNGKLSSKYPTAKIVEETSSSVVIQFNR